VKIGHSGERLGENQVTKQNRAIQGFSEQINFFIFPPEKLLICSLKVYEFYPTKG
jgi:hypothetical protein